MCIRDRVQPHQIAQTLDDVLSELGYSTADIDGFVSNGAVRVAGEAAPAKRQAS